MPFRVVMMGTGTFALPTFQQLILSEHEVVGLVTQPDRRGRGHHHHPHPMKETALAAGVPVFQPENVNDPESLSELGDVGAELFVVAAYGQILSAELIEIPPLGAINLHASILPKYRGAAPVQYALWKGESETGVTIFQIEPKLDAGPILGTMRTPIGWKETAGKLHDRLAELAVPLTLEVLSKMESGRVDRQFQDPALVTKAPRVRKQQGLIAWSQTSREIGWQVSAMQPWPMPFTFLHRPGEENSRVLILDVEPAESLGEVSSGNHQPGDVIPTQDERLLVRTGDGVLEILALQPAGKRVMTAADFLHGHSLAGARFGPDSGT